MNTTELYNIRLDTGTTRDSDNPKYDADAMKIHSVLSKKSHKCTVIPKYDLQP